MLSSEIDHLLRQRPIPVGDIIVLMVKASLPTEDSDFPTILNIANLDEPLDQQLAVPAMAVLPAWGEQGIVRLHEMVVDGPHNSAAIAILVTVALGRVPTSKDILFLRDHWDSLKKYTLPENLPRYAQKRLRQLMLEDLSEPYEKSRLLNTIYSQWMYTPDAQVSTERSDFLTALLIDSHLILNQSLLQQFELLLDSCPKKEEELHQYLVDHPVLLDPFAAELRTKHKLGDDFITDFYIRRINNEYVAVEIENSTDSLFNKDGTFNAHLVEAVGQVIDFQAWVSNNIAYARTKLPGILHPDGLVIIGRRRGFTEAMETKLKEENFSRRGHIKIVTFDDLLNQAKIVYHNTIEKPVVLHARDQKSL